MDGFAGGMDLGRPAALRGRETDDAGILLHLLLHHDGIFHDLVDELINDGLLSRFCGKFLLKCDIQIFWHRLYKVYRTRCP